MPAKIRPKSRKRRIEAFLAVMAKGGTVQECANAARISRRAAFKWRATDAKFAAAWAEAYESGSDMLEAKSIEIATKGFVKRRIVRADGTVVEERELSERHLELQLKARRPTIYRERSSVEVTGKNGAPIATEEVVTDQTRARALLALLNHVKMLQLPAPTVEATVKPATPEETP